MGLPQQWQDAPDGQDAVIRIWQPNGFAANGGARRVSLELTLSEFVRVYFKPVVLVSRDARPATVAEIDQSVKYWVQFTGDPPLGAISVYHAADYIAGLKTLPGRRYQTIGNNTIRKHAGAIQQILDLCGPAGRNNRDGVGLYEAHDVPWIARPPKGETQAEETYTREEIQRIYDQAHAANLPNRLACSAGDYLRLILRLDAATGMRPIEFMNATWRHFHGDHLILQARVGTKGHRDRRIELNADAQAAIHAARGFDAERIFPWPRRWPGSKGQLYKQLTRVLDAAGFPKDRRFGFKGIRRLHNFEMIEINPMAAQKSLGHTTARMTIEHYTSRKVVAAAVAKLAPLRSSNERQQRLFD